MQDLIQRVYDRVLRPRLPRVLGVYNSGIPARADRLLDATRHHPSYEEAFIDGIRTTTKPGDDVVIVGGGFGVSAVAAARAVGERGHVTVFEASREHVGIVRETLSLNDVADRVSVHHAVVGEAVSTYGPLAGASEVPPRHLPGCDVLALDCEGAEIPILKRMEYRPEAVVVESHGYLGAGSVDVHAELAALDYELVWSEPEIAEKDVVVLSAVHAGADPTRTDSDDARGGFEDVTPGVRPPKTGLQTDGAGD